MSVLLAVGVLGALAALACLAGLLLAVAPFVVAVDLAERRGLSTARAGAVALAGLSLAAVVALVLLRAEFTPLALLLPAGLAWTVPSVLSLARPGLPFAGRTGAHERPVRPR